MTTTTHLPAYVRAIRDSAGRVTNQGELPLWSGKGEPPPIGAVITCNDRPKTQVVVTAYSVEGGWLMIHGYRQADPSRSGNLAGAEILWS
jgi:hypothetical protein